MLYDLGMTVLLAFGVFCVIAWGFFAVVGIARIPDLICDAVEGAVRLGSKVFTTNSSEETVKRRSETSSALVVTLCVMVPVMGLATFLG